MAGFMTEVMDSNTPVALYSYPTDAAVVNFQNQAHEVHLILGGDADPTTNYTKAPNGSIYVCLHATATNNKLWAKFGTLGQTDGVWQGTAQMT